MRRFLYSFQTILALLVISLAASWLLLKPICHLQLLAVQTDSMRPTFSSGDVLVVQKGSKLALGSMVTYQSPKNPRELISHRIVRLMPSEHSLQTKGDALQSADPIITDRLVVGHVWAVLPGLGRTLGTIESWPGLLLVLYLPAAGIVWLELRRLERHYARLRIYRLPSSGIMKT